MGRIDPKQKHSSKVLYVIGMRNILSLIRCCYIARLNFTRGGVGLKYQLQRFLDGYLDQDVDQFAYQTK